MDVAIALCLVGIARLHMREQVRCWQRLVAITLLSSLPQLQRQVRETGGYGKGVVDILVKEDDSLPAFVAVV